MVCRHFLQLKKLVPVHVGHNTRVPVSKSDRCVYCYEVCCAKVARTCTPDAHNFDLSRKNFNFFYQIFKNWKRDKHDVCEILRSKRACQPPSNKATHLPAKHSALTSIEKLTYQVQCSISRPHRVINIKHSMYQGFVLRTQREASRMRTTKNDTKYTPRNCTSK